MIIYTQIHLHNPTLVGGCDTFCMFHKPLVLLIIGFHLHSLSLPQFYGCNDTKHVDLANSVKALDISITATRAADKGENCLAQLMQFYWNLFESGK